MNLFIYAPKLTQAQLDLILQTVARVYASVSYLIRLPELPSLTLSDLVKPLYLSIEANHIPAKLVNTYRLYQACDLAHVVAIAMSLDWKNLAKDKSLLIVKETALSLNKPLIYFKLD